MKSIEVLSIENDEQELNAFPVEGCINVLLSEQVDLGSISKFVYLLLSTPNSPNLGATSPDILTETYQDVFEEIECEYKQAAVGGDYQLTIVPVEPLLPGRQYHLVISKNLPPRYWVISKLSSSGGSSISFSPDKVSPLTIDTTYRLEIGRNSLLAKGQHIIAYDLIQGVHILSDNKALDITKSGIAIDTGVIQPSSTTPFIAGEGFSVFLEAFTRLGVTVTQTINTFVPSHKFEGTEERSERIRQEDILKFYQRTGMAQRTKEQLNNGVGSIVTGRKMRITFQHPNMIHLDLGIKINPATLTAAAFKIRLGYAFGNYLLPQLGMYDTTKEFVYRWSLQEDQIITIEVLDADTAPSPATDPHIGSLVMSNFSQD